MTHKHTFDSKGNQLCCTQAEKIYTQAGAKNLIAPANKEDSSHDDHDHDVTGKSNFQLFIPSILSFILLMLAITFDNWFPQEWFGGWIRLGWYITAYAPVGFPVLIEAWESIKKREVFSEFFLMGIATIGAFIIAEYPEAVAVMLFYAVGELFQTLAVNRAKANIKSLLDQRLDEVTVIKDNMTKAVKAESVEVGEILQLKAGEKLGLDGDLLSERGSFNTSALTGESKPDNKSKGERVLAGMINLSAVTEVRVTAAYKDNKLSRILELVQDATSQKAPTELFIRKFAKVYTPIVVVLAILICVVPYFFVTEYVFNEWAYRALVFLVISCPCALVISIPLGYFGGIGAGSKNGILFKGSNFLDQLATVKNVVMDKTGTLTEGVFEVQEVNLESHIERKKLLDYVNALESKSTHPIASAIRQYVGEVDTSIYLDNVEEIAGNGLKASINGNQLLVGNFKLMDSYGISYSIDPNEIINTVIAIAYADKFAGYITIADRIKEESHATILALSEMGVTCTMLSGDKATIVKHVARQLSLDQAYGDLLPEDKVNKVKEIKMRKESVAFVGDGVNDALVVALSDVGIAMGGLGSDATIEIADVVIQDDNPIKIPMAIRIGKATKKIVLQNITLAFTVKIIVLILGAGGLATMWEAVFADVGVALLAILNAIRIQKMKF